MTQLVDRAAAIRAIEAVIDRHPDAMIALARQKAAAGDRVGAAELSLSAIDDIRCSAESRAIAAELLGSEVPAWHFTIVRDRVRNLAYQRALERVIFPGCTVLEIGTGTGLLAMMAARAGAARVVTCEADPVIALAAERVIARNGYADRVRVIAKNSQALDPLSDLGGPADVLVSEIVSNDLLGEFALDAMEDAVRRLVKPTGVVIPVRGRIMVALAEDQQSARSRMPIDCGFDLSPFDPLAKSYREFPVHDTRIVMRSEPEILFEFDFATGGPYQAESKTSMLTSFGGNVGGTIQWIELDMDSTGHYQNRPGNDQKSCWAAVFRPFFNDIISNVGEKICIGSSHDRTAVRIWPESGL